MQITIYRLDVDWPNDEVCQHTVSKEEYTGRVTLADDEIIVDFDHAPLAHFPASSLVLLTQHYCIIHSA